MFLELEKELTCSRLSLAFFRDQVLFEEEVRILKAERSRFFDQKGHYQEIDIHNIVYYFK